MHAPRIIGWRLNGQPIVSICGGSDDATPPGTNDGDDDTSDTDDGDTPDDGDAGDDVAKWKALARKHERQAKANAEAAKRLQEMEDASKSDTEKLSDRASAAEKRAAEAEGKYLRLEVALEKGLTAKQAGRLVGSTKEELEADADELLETFGGGKPPSVPRRPAPRLSGGGDPDDEPEETDPRKLAAHVSLD